MKKLGETVIHLDSQIKKLENLKASLNRKEDDLIGRLYIQLWETGLKDSN